MAADPPSQIGGSANEDSVIVGVTDLVIIC